MRKPITDDLDPAAGFEEGACLAKGRHGSQHGTRAEAVLGDAGDAHHTSALTAAGSEQVGVAAWLGWALDPCVLEDARGQAVPFTGDETASDRAWAARLDHAVQGMDVLDPGGFDVWANAHALSAQPHLAEAELVSAWETWVRNEYGNTSDDVQGSAETASEAQAEAGRDDAEWAL